MTRHKKRQRSLTIRTSQFNLHSEGPGRWRVDGKDLSGKRRRVRFNAETEAKAIIEAEKLLQQPTRQDEFPTILIDDAFIEAAKGRDWTDYTRKSDRRSILYFLDWVDERGLEYWHQLTLSHIAEYKAGLQERDLAADSIRLYLNPIRRTSKWIAANWPKHYTDICSTLRLSNRVSRSAVYDGGEGNPSLSICEVLDFLDYLTQEPGRDRLTPGVALQGIAGLQMQEALRMTWNKVDFEAGTVTIDGMVKNAFRIRCIPIPETLQWILRRARNLRAGSLESDPIVVGYKNHDSYARAVRRCLRSWDPQRAIAPKDFRNTLQAVAYKNGWEGYYLSRYVGHSPRSISERHYVEGRGERLVPLYLEKVVANVEKQIAKWNAPEGSSLIQRPRLVNVSVD